MGAKVKDLLGMTFGRLTVIRRTDNRGRDGCVIWECLCKCGNITCLTGPQLKTGSWVSCGCYRRELSRKYNTYIVCEDFTIVMDSKNRQTYIDTADFNLIKDYYWHSANGYFQTVTGAKNHPIKMHNLIYGPVQKGCEVDHKNRVKHDNRRSNLRESTRSQNNINHGLSKINTSGFVGVSKQKGRFRAYITVGGKQKHLGSFDSPEEAYLHRLKAERKYFGDFSSNKEEVMNV